jgi:hypothetical protein
MMTVNMLAGRARAGRAVIAMALAALLLPLIAVPGAMPARAATCAASSPATSYGGGSGTESDPYRISDVAELLRLAASAQSADWDKHFLQTADIDLAGCDWTPISFDQTPWVAGTPMFSGTYDGGGREVRNMSFDQTGKNNAGMFGVVNGATIQNLRLGIEILSDRFSVGGLIGIVYEQGVTVRDVRVDVDMVAAAGNAGGMIGEADGPVLIERVRVTGSLSVGGAFYVGGIVGQHYGSELVIADSVSSVAISSTSNSMTIGGVLGVALADPMPTRITRTTFTGSITGAGPAVGGIIGAVDWTAVDAVVSDVRVTASEITGVRAVGGVVGGVNRVNTLVIEQTVVRAPVTASLEFGGCLIGRFAAGTEEKTTVTDSFSRSTTTVAGETTQCPFPPDPTPAAPSFVAPGGVLPALPAGVGAWVQADGSSVPLAVSSPGVNQLRYAADGIEVTFTGGSGSSVSNGLVADANGEVVCEICVALAAGQVIEVWMFSTPRLVAAHLIADLPCQRFSMPVVSPLDGGGPVSAGAHTLQLALPTSNGMQAVNVGVTVGGPVPASVPAGEGSVPFGAVLFVLLGAAGVLVAGRRLVTAG